jgi:hypothetical protein
MTMLPRNWLAAHEAGHILYAVMKGKKVKYAYITNVQDIESVTKLVTPFENREDQIFMCAAGAAGELVCSEKENSCVIDLVSFARDLQLRTESDRQKFNQLIDYQGSVIKDPERPSGFFVRYAKSYVADKYLTPNYEKFCSIKLNLEEYGFVGPSMIELILNEKVIEFNQVQSDYLAIPKKRRRVAKLVLNVK